MPPPGRCFLGRGNKGKFLPLKLTLSTYPENSLRLRGHRCTLSSPPVNSRSRGHRDV